jgi:hypothetical protein
LQVYAPPVGAGLAGDGGGTFHLDLGCFAASPAGRRLQGSRNPMQYEIILLRKSSFCPELTLIFVVYRVKISIPTFLYCTPADLAGFSLQDGPAHEAESVKAGDGLSVNASPLGGYIQ